MAKKLSMDKVLQKAAEAAAEEAVEKKFEEVNSGRQESDEGVLFKEEESDEEHEGETARERYERKKKEGTNTPVLEKLLSQLPNAEGYYLKLYREDPLSGKSEYKLRIDNYDTWCDIETEISNIVRLKTRQAPSKWGSGNYKIIAFKEGRQGCASRSFLFSIDAAEEENTRTPLQAPPERDVKDKITELSELIKSVQGLVSQDKIKPEEIHKMLGESFKAGLNAIPQLQSIQQPPPLKENDINYLAIIAGALPILKELGIIGQPKIDPQQIVKDTLSMLKDMGVIGKPQKDERQVLSENITMLKELGVLGVDREKVDTLSEIDKIKSIIEAVSGIAGLRGDGGQPQSVALEVVKTLAPHIPGVIDKVTGTMNNMVDLQKQKISMAPTSSESRQHRVALRPLPPTEVKEEPTPQEEKVQSTSTEPQFFHPLLGEIYQAIQKNDTSKYEYIYNRLTKMFPGTQLNTTEEAFSILVNIGGEPFNNEKTFDYVTEFVRFINSQKVETVSEEPLANSYEIVAICPKCSAEFDFQSKEFFEKLSAADRMCGERLSSDPSDICDGMLILEEKKVKGNGSGEHVEDHADVEEEILEQSVEEGAEEKKV